MNEKIREHVRAYNERCGCVDQTEQDIIDTIRDAKVIWSKMTSSRRWWDEEFCVVDIDGMLIGYDGADTTGDENATEKGWEFDPSSICEVIAQQVVKTEYVRA
jgi:hypothetical protein